MQEPITVLLAEDDPHDGELLVRALQRAGFAPVWTRVCTEDHFAEALRQHPELVLCDYRMPEFDALRALQLLAEYDSEIPLIIVSGTIGEDLAVEAMKYGAADYLLKDRLGRLGPAIRQALARSRERRHRRLAEAAMRQRAELQDQLARIAAAVPGMIYAFRRRADGTMSLPYTNAALEQVYGLSLEAVRRDAQPLFDAIDPGDRTRVAQSIARSARTLTPWREEFRICNPRIGTRWLAAHALPSREQDGGTLWHGFAADITPEKEAQQALVESEERYRTLVQTAFDWIWEVDLEGCFTFTSPQLQEVLGYRPEEVHGRSAFDLMSPTEAARLRDVFQHAATSHAPVREFRTSRRHRDGREVITDTSAVPLVGPDGVCRGFRGVDRDVTARVQTETAIRISEEQFRAVFELAAIAMAQTNPATGRFVNVNRRMCDLTGYTAAELLERSIADLTHPDDREADWQDYTRLVQGQTPDYQREKRYVRKDGSIAWVLVNVTLLRDAAGHPYRTLAAIQDMTERRQLDLQLRLLHQAVEQSPACIVITDAEGRIEYVNPRFTELTGYTREEAQGVNPRILQSGVTPRSVFQTLWREITSGRQWRGEFCNRKKSGELYWEQACISPVVDRSGRITRYLAVKEDITAQKQAAVERERLEAQLRQGQKMEAIGTLAGGIAHDFNNILASILGNAELACSQADDNPELRECLDEVIKAGRRAKDLVHQILAFSRQQPLRRQPVSLTPVILESLRLLRAAFPASADVACTLQDEVPEVFGDPTHLQQVVINLCTNSLHALEGRPGRIELSLEKFQAGSGSAEPVPGLAPGPYACLRVTDTGHGIDPSVLDRIFDPFFTTKPPGQGSGLGLAVVDGILRAHEAKVSVESTVGVGTTFRLYFPAAQSPTPTQPARSEPPLHGAGQRILYLDDEEALVELAQRLLRRLGYEVRGFTCPRAALDAYYAGPELFDAVVTDFNMPGQNGLEVASAILARRPGIPVVLSSGYLTQDIEAQARRIGIRHLLHKPNSVEVLGEALHRILSSSGDP